MCVCTHVTHALPLSHLQERLLSRALVKDDAGVCSDVAYALTVPIRQVHQAVLDLGGRAEHPVEGL